ncbi:MAG TPA: response regulator transcription factor [Gemmatimonadales bacterium]|nr:response regulator transcription factor [Gemmatimonadales bacterium]
MRVLIVEDDPGVADLLARTVREATWAPDLAATGAQALALLPVNAYDLVVLDAGLPDIDGFEVCRRWRKTGGKTPILILTARAAVADRVRGLDAGADDYLAKPFAIEELLARLRALARRPGTALDVTLRFAGLELDTQSLTAHRAGRTIELSHRELALLEYLLRNPNRVVSRAQILEKVWDDNFDPVGNVVDVLVGRLRRKIGSSDLPPLIHTVRGRGYILAEREPADGA